MGEDEARGLPKCRGASGDSVTLLLDEEDRMENGLEVSETGMSKRLEAKLGIPH